MNLMPSTFIKNVLSFKICLKKGIGDTGQSSGEICLELFASVEKGLLKKKKKKKKKVHRRKYWL